MLACLQSLSSFLYKLASQQTPSTHEKNLVQALFHNSELLLKFGGTVESFLYILRNMLHYHFCSHPASPSSRSEVAQSCPTLWGPMNCSLPSSSVHGIFLARVLERVAISFSRGSSRPRDRTRVSLIVGRRFTVWATREAPLSKHLPNSASISTVQQQVSGF